MAVDGGSDSEAGTGDLANDRKIRDSCNACSSHKIRCTKERPACRRCALKGLQCEYSVSRRNGKRRRSDAPSECGYSISRRNGKGSKPDAPGSRPERENTPGIMSSAFALDDFDQLYDMAFDVSGNPPNISDDTWMLAGTATDPEETCVSIAVVGMRDIDETAYLQQQSTEGFAAPSLFAQTQDFRGEQMVMRAPCRPSQFPDQNARSTTVSALHGRGEDCTARALGIVMQMHIAPKMCSAPDPTSMHSRTQSSRTEARDIDTVLQVNREAISILNNILDCSACINDHMCMLACYIATQKTVAWYAAILGNDSGGHGADLAELVSARPIFMGSFSLGREAQRLVHASVIMSEVRDHVKPLVARLSTRGPPLVLPLLSPSSSPARSCGDLAESTACKLHDQVASILARASPLHG